MGQISKVDQVPTATIAKINGITYDSTGPIAGEVTKVNGIYVVQPELPSGIIIGLQGVGAVPSGWAIYNSADGKYIVGAGSTYAVDANGGSLSVTPTLSNTGNHTGSTAINNVATNGGQRRNSSSTGAHANTVTPLNYTPPYQGLRLIKASSDQADVPQDGVFFWYGTDDLTDIATNVFTDGYMFSAQAAAGTGGSDTLSPTFSSAGAHGHGISDSGDGSGTPAATTAGSHSHAGATIVVTNSLYIAALSAWSDAAAAIAFGDVSNKGQGMIALYENTTPPSGWYLCDGTNGTPDLQDYFLKTVAYGSAGSKTGDGTISSASTIAHAVHNHRQSSGDGGSGGTGYHDDNVAMDSHTVTMPAYTPPYYALAFIQFGG